jgi:hypothetical protein
MRVCFHGGKYEDSGPLGCDGVYSYRRNRCGMYTILSIISICITGNRYKIGKKNYSCSLRFRYVYAHGTYNGSYNENC